MAAVSKLLSECVEKALDFVERVPAAQDRLKDPQNALLYQYLW